MGKISIETEVGQVSDGYHTFNELYQHRYVLFIALMKSNPDISWRSQKHSGGDMFDHMFVAGMNLPTGEITYHLPMWMWSDTEGIRTLDHAPVWDGYTPNDVICRLTEWRSE